MKSMSYSKKESNIAIVNGKNLPISRKVAREIGVFIKGKTIEAAISDLEKVIDGKLAVPYKRFNKDASHRRGNMMSGRFPKRTSEEIIKLLNSLRTNAENKGLNTAGMRIIHAASQHASIAWRWGRQRRRRRKISHFELIAIETEKKKEVSKKSINKKIKEKIADKKILTSEVNTKLEINTLEKSSEDKK